MSQERPLPLVGKLPPRLRMPVYAGLTALAGLVAACGGGTEAERPNNLPDATSDHQPVPTRIAAPTPKVEAPRSKEGILDLGKWLLTVQFWDEIGLEKGMVHVNIGTTIKNVGDEVLSSKTLAQNFIFRMESGGSYSRPVYIIYYDLNNKLLEERSVEELWRVPPGKEVVVKFSFEASKSKDFAYSFEVREVRGGLVLGKVKWSEWVEAHRQK